MFVFLDAIRHTSRQYGYSERRKQQVDQRLLVGGNRVSGLVLMSVKGLLDVMIINETANGDYFL